MNLEKVADVLEAAATYLDAVEGEKQAEVRASREGLIAEIGEKYAGATGEDISDELLRKLADADVDLLSILEKVADVSSDEVAELGSPSDLRDSTVPLNKKEAAAAADDRFLDFVLTDS
jgi:hypothetical protein